MEASLWLPFISALWLGILTSVSPCPLASNVAAISFVSRKIVNPSKVLRAGISYTLGRMSAYTILGVLIILSVLSVPVTAVFLQKYMNKLLGPVLIIVALYLLDIVKPGFSVSVSEERKKKLAEKGVAGAFALGFVFALSFCPISAALFFGSLIPLAIKHGSGPVLPFVYGAGTAIPVLLFSVTLAAGVRSVSAWFQCVTKAENVARKATGIVFLLVGGYYIWQYLLR